MLVFRYFRVTLNRRRHFVIGRSSRGDEMTYEIESVFAGRQTGTSTSKPQYSDERIDTFIRDRLRYFDRPVQRGFVLV